jgi:hypothetical protein
MLRLLALPIELLRIAFYALQGLVDAVRARNRLNLEFSVLVNAPRDAVWQFSAADRMVLDGPPVLEISREPIPDSDDLWLTRLLVSGQPRTQGVGRELVRDEAEGVIIAQMVAHELSVPPEGGRNVKSGMRVEATEHGTSLTVFSEMTVSSFRDRIIYPIGLRRMATLIKQQCETEAGTHSRAAALANNGVILSLLALLSFCYLFGKKVCCWQSSSPFMRPDMSRRC